jgi:AcrR family transcriptional regulator
VSLEILIGMSATTLRGQFRTPEMHQKDRPRPNKHQLRTAETRAKLLAAASQLLTEQGFENTQLEEVAARAGYTRGAIYAHYTSKEDLFLELLRERIERQLAELRAVLGSEPSTAKRLEKFRGWMTHQIADPLWPILTLEFQLYALRRPSARAKLQGMYELLCEPNGQEFAKLLFRERLSKSNALNARRRLALLGALLSAAVVATKFHPELLPRKALQRTLNELMVAFLQI